MTTSKHIILTGFMGVGKSTVGKLVAQKLNLPFVDLDAEIAKSTGMPVDFYIHRFGVEAFRRWERRLLGQALRQQASVLVPGGGIVMDPENRKKMKQFGLVVWLKAPKKVLLERLQDQLRPLLAERDRGAQMERLLKERWPYYQECTCAVETTFLKPEQVADEVVKQLGVSS